MSDHDVPPVKKQTKLNAATPQDKALSAQAHCFLCSAQTPSLQVFREKTFIHMLKSMDSNYTGGKVLSIEQLKSCVDAEWQMFLSCVRQELNEQSEDAK